MAVVDTLPTDDALATAGCVWLTEETGLGGEDVPGATVRELDCPLCCRLYPAAGVDMLRGAL